MEEKQKLLTYLRRDASVRRQRRDELNEDIFFDHELQRDLEEVFFCKCAFCETRVAHDGRVLHFRPLRFADFNGSENKDYYLWLAFEWRNLFLSCQYCFKLKGSRFPLEGDSAFYLASFEDTILQERPLLLDPTTDDPGRHLRFLFDGNVVPLTARGQASTEIFELNRLELVSRRSHLIAQMGDLLQSPPSATVELELLTMLRAEAEHSGALQNVLRRIGTAWRATTEPIRGSGEAFIRRFLDAWRHSSDFQRSQLATAVRDVKASGSEVEGAGGPVIPESLRSVLERVPQSRLSSVSHEISTISISSFKAIEHLTLNMPASRSARSGLPSMMILGENSTGKSSTLAAIALALVGRREASKLRKYLPSLVRSADSERFDKLDDRRVEVDVQFHFSEQIAAFRFDPARQLIDGTEHQSSIVLAYGPRRFFDPRKRRRAPGASARIRT
jgi:uncharacterized protein (TIGR02646 family)